MRPNSKSSAVVPIRPLTELLRDLDGAREACGLSSDGPSSLSSERPSSRAKYAGGLEPRGVVGDCGLLERTAVRGDENVLRGRGRAGVCSVRSDVELELDEEEMTEAFLLRSARVGVGCAEHSGDGEETWILSMRGGGREEKEKRGEKDDGRCGEISSYRIVVGGRGPDRVYTVAD